jgi:hypothetical protein
MKGRVMDLRFMVLHFCGGYSDAGCGGCGGDLEDCTCDMAGADTCVPGRI